MSLFPMFVKLEGRLCLVVGAGAVGETKIESLLAAGATVHVVAPHATPKVREWARAGRIEWSARHYVPADLAGAFLVIAATGSPALGGDFWFFHAPLTDLQYTITVTDSRFRTVRTYTSTSGSPGQLCGGVDTSAFPGP